MNFRKIAEGRIPGLRQIQERAKHPPDGHRAVPEAEVIRRLTPLVNSMVSGAVPLDDANKDAYAHVAEHHYRRYKGMQRH